MIEGAFQYAMPVMMALIFVSMCAGVVAVALLSVAAAAWALSFFLTSVLSAGLLVEAFVEATRQGRGPVSRLWRKYMNYARRHRWTIH